MNTQKIVAGAAALLLIASLRAQIIENYPVNRAIPDGNGVGISDTQTIVNPAGTITSIKVTLNITGDYNGDLYVQLRHDSGFSILLNRAGVTSSDPFGYADGGFNITLNNSAANDIHFYQNFTAPGARSPVTGEWQPDGRPDPTLPARGASLNSFVGLNPNGNWTLVAADLQNSGNSQLVSWGVQMTVVPEPAEIALAAGAASLAFAFWHRHRSRKQTAS